MMSAALEQGQECRLAGLAQTSNNRTSFFFPSGEVTISPVSTSVIKTPETCLGGGSMYFRPTLVKQEPEDFSVSNLNTCVSQKKNLTVTQQARISVPPGMVIIKTETPSSLSCNEAPAETILSHESPLPGRSSDSIDLPVNTSTATGESTTGHDEIGLPPSSSSPQLPRTDVLSKVPVMRIRRRQDSSSLYATTTTTSNCIAEPVPLKVLPTSNNLERVCENSSIVAPLIVTNGDVAAQHSELRMEGVTNTDLNAPRKARLKFSPRIRRSENLLVPVHSFYPKTGDPTSLSVGDKENVNTEGDVKEKQIVYQWDMSAFPKCVVQLKKLPLKMETMLLSRSTQEHTKLYCASPDDKIFDDCKELSSLSQKTSSSDVPHSRRLTESKGENGFIFEDGRKKRRSIEPREKTRCSFCGMLTQSADVWRHLLAVYKVKDDLKNEVIENQETLVCKVCGAGLCSEIALSIHMHHLHSKKEFDPTYNCIVCEEKFPTETYLALHLQKHCSKQQEQQARLRKVRQSALPTVSNSSKQYECPICKKQFQSYQGLNAHKKLHRRQQIQECNICGKTFTKSYKLKCHMVVHTDDRPFTCTECGKSFRFKSSLRSHKFFHLGVNPYKCKYCNQGFLEGGNLLKHIRRTHQGHRSEICNICGKVFTDKQALKYHMRLHTDIHQKRAARESASSVQSIAPKSLETRTTSNDLVGNAVDISDSVPIDNNSEINKDPSLAAAGQSSYENSVLFHLLTSPQRDKQKDGNPEAQQVVDLYEWSESTTDTTSEHDSGMNSPPQTQRECLLCDMTFNTIQKLKKHLLSYHRINPGKLQRLIG